MDVRSALKHQYRGGLAMLRQCVELCPEDLWTAGGPERGFWRIAYHALFYTDLYGVQDEAAFRPWAAHSDGARSLWGDGPETEPYSRAQILTYLDLLAAGVETRVDGLDLEAAETGYAWYPDMTKLDHQIMTIRHLQGHVGQLSERLLAAGIETDWNRGR